ncbi:hypothetical protein [uncultured Butyricimonas sp.]|uniref:hypothetical protein n=1 Tax=uncultured Butyricimonas sp. TaxID=1268785 RepID=UPI0026DC6DCB|nr:hypothetical protein [uncultured Butyricimonas sp.]
MKYRLLFIVFLFACCFACESVIENQQFNELDLEENILIEDGGLSRSVDRGVTENMNAFLQRVDFFERQFIELYQSYDTIISEGILRQKWYECINRFDKDAARVYQDLCINKSRGLFKNDEDLENYFRSFRIYSSRCKQVVDLIVRSVEDLRSEIIHELEYGIKPIEPDERPETIRYTLSETIKETRGYWGTWEEVGKVGGPGPLFTSLDEFDFIDVACLVDNYNRQNLYTYNNFAFSTPRKAEGFQAIMKIVNDRGNLILLGVRVHHEDSHTIYLYVIDAHTYEIYDRLEVAVYYRYDFNDRYETEADSRRFLVKDWMFKDDYKIVVGELKTDVAAKFNEDFGTLEAEVIRTTYKYNVNTNKFVQVEQKSVRNLQYCSENVVTNWTPLSE